MKSRSGTGLKDMLWFWSVGFFFYYFNIEVLGQASDGRNSLHKNGYVDYRMTPEPPLGFEWSFNFKWTVPSKKKKDNFVPNTSVLSFLSDSVEGDG